MLLFLAWALCCVVAVIARWHVVWAALCLAPLLLLSLIWLDRPAHDPFGFYPWGAIALFAGVAIVVAATSVLGVVRGLLAR